MIPRMQIFSNTACGGLADVIDRTLEGPNVVADTNILWQTREPLAEVRNFNNNTPYSFDDTNACVPFGALEVSSGYTGVTANSDREENERTWLNPEGEHRIIPAEEGQCLVDRAPIAWGQTQYPQSLSRTGTTTGDSIFDLFGKVTTYQPFDIREVHRGNPNDENEDGPEVTARKDYLYYKVNEPDDPNRDFT